MVFNNVSKQSFSLDLKAIRKNRCTLILKNKSGVKAYIVLYDVENEITRELIIRRTKKLKVLKGTYVIEAWLDKGNIGINPDNLQHVEIENIPSRLNTMFRGKKIVADLFHEREQMIFFEEITVSDIIQRQA